MSPDYALRGTLGANYQLTDNTSVGAYDQTKQAFQFDNAFLLNLGPAQITRDSRMDLPANFGLGVANSELMDGNLLLGVDLLYTNRNCSTPSMTISLPCRSAPNTPWVAIGFGPVMPGRKIRSIRPQTPIWVALSSQAACLRCAAHRA